MQDLLKQLLELMPLAAAATEGPWAYCPTGDYEGWSIIKKVGIEERYEMLPDFASVIDENDADFIAAARNLLTPENLTLLMAALKGADHV